MRELLFHDTCSSTFVHEDRLIPTLSAMLFHTGTDKSPRGKTNDRCEEGMVSEALGWIRAVVRECMSIVRCESDTGKPDVSARKMYPALPPPPETTFAPPKTHFIYVGLGTGHGADRRR